MRVDGRLVATKAVTRPRFALVVTLPQRDVTIRVSAIDPAGDSFDARRAGIRAAAWIARRTRGRSVATRPRGRSAGENRPLARPPLSRDLRRLRPGPSHRSRRRLERARPLPGGVDAEARDRRRADAGAPRSAPARLAARGAPLADARLLGRPLGQRAPGGPRRLDDRRLGARELDDARARPGRQRHVRRLPGRGLARPLGDPARDRGRPSFIGKATTAWDLAGSNALSISPPEPAARWSGASAAPSRPPTPAT